MHLRHDGDDDDDETRYTLSIPYFPDNYSSSRIPTYDEIVNERDEDDDEEFEKAEEFERKFNFRYQEPDAEFVCFLLHSHSRTLLLFF